MRRTIKAILIICVMSSCGATMKEPQKTLPPLVISPVSTIAPTTAPPLEAHEALQADIADVTTTTGAPLVSDPQDFIDQARATWGNCGEWRDTIIAVGGREEDWPTWSRILHIESRCIPTASNGACVGLTQIYFKVHEAWLSEFSFDKEDLLDPIKNLTFAVALQKSSGWSPWAYLNMP